MTARLLLAAVLLAAPATAEPLRVYAAASLAEAAEDAADAYARAGHERPVVVLAGSPELARQIAAGAPADVAWLADQQWMDWLAARRLVRPTDARVVASNRLVLITPAAARPVQLAALARVRWTTADPAGVPLGRYTQAALTASNLWTAVRPNLVAAADARAALALVERRAVGAGIVYATDARASRRVRVSLTIPAASHPPITYPAAPTARGGANAAAFVAFLASPTGQRVLARRGFTPPPTELKRAA